MKIGGLGMAIFLVAFFAMGSEQLGVIVKRTGYYKGVVVRVADCGYAVKGPGGGCMVVIKLKGEETGAYVPGLKPKLNDSVYLECGITRTGTHVCDTTWKGWLREESLVGGEL
jgi:hypothetical protein